MDEKKLLDDKELEQVSGGRVDKNMYPHLVFMLMLFMAF